MNITDWPKAERPREKLLTHGPHALSDAELLAIFIRTGIKGKTAVDLARELLNELGDIRSLLDIDAEKFCQFSGLGVTKYVILQAALEISNRYLCETIKRQNVLRNFQDVKLYLTSRLRNCRQEIFAVIFLDTQNRIICYEELTKGSIDKIYVYPRELIKKILAYNSSAIIIAHNHPSGAVEPSQMDKKITRKLLLVLQVIDVKLLDHIIIGEGAVLSFAEMGILKTSNPFV
jgi:DNA repair protein RadC